MFVVSHHGGVVESLNVPRSHVRDGRRTTTSAAAAIADNNNRNNNRVLDNDHNIPEVSRKLQDLLFVSDTSGVSNHLVRGLVADFTKEQHETLVQRLAVEKGDDIESSLLQTAWNIVLQWLAEESDSNTTAASLETMTNGTTTNETAAENRIGYRGTGQEGVQADTIVISILLSRVLLALLVLLGTAAPISLGVLSHILEDCHYLIVAEPGMVVAVDSDSNSTNGGGTRRTGQILRGTKEGIVGKQSGNDDVESDQIVISILLSRILIALLVVLGVATPISLGVLTHILEGCYNQVLATDGIVTIPDGVSKSSLRSYLPPGIRP